MAHRGDRYGLSGFCAATATIGVLLVIGLWDNQRTLQRALDEGYNTTAVVHLIRNNRLPVAPGWRPRFLGSGYTVDLGWRGRDGVERLVQRVPVSSEFVDTLMRSPASLDRVEIRALDDSGAIPAILSDADNRLRFIGGFMTYAVWWTLAAAVAFVGTLIWRARQKEKASALSGETLAPAGRAIGSPAGRAPVIPPRPPSAPRRVPYQFLIVTLFALVVGATMSIRALLDRHSYDAIRDHGTEAIAWITDAHLEAGGTRLRVSHAIDLAWRDGSGDDRRFGPTHISEQFWAGISSHEMVVRRQVRIRYLEDDRTVRPLIAEDVAEWLANDRLGTAFGGVFLTIGLVLTAITIRRMRPA